jgi:hypothetical protein
VLLSLLYRLVRCLLGVLAVLVRSDLSRRRVRRHENQALRRQTGGRLRWDHTDPALACGVVTAGEPPPVGGDLPGQPGHDPALAPVRCHNSSTARDLANLCSALVFLRLLYLLMVRLFGWLTLLARTDLLKSFHRRALMGERVAVLDGEAVEPAGASRVERPAVWEPAEFVDCPLDSDPGHPFTAGWVHDPEGAVGAACGQ